MAEEQVLNTHNSEILLSAANKSHYPQDDLPEVALAGRSNVGKSSFINTLLGRKNLARTSGKPATLCGCARLRLCPCVQKRTCQMGEND